MNVAVKLDLLLLLLWLIVSGIFYYLGIDINWINFVSFLPITILGVNCFFHFKVFKPLNKFIRLADKVADGEVKDGLEDLRMRDLEEVEGSFVKVVGNLIESKLAIEEYMHTISGINIELEEKVKSLSVLYGASQEMGSSLNLDTLTRNFIHIFTEKLGISGGAVMLFNEKTDLVSIKDLIGISSVLFAKFRFFSGNRIVAECFSENGYWKPTERDMEILTGEFETPDVRDIKLMFPMRIKDHFVGLIVLGAKKDNSDYSETEILLIQALSGLASTSINNAKLFEKSESTKNELDHKVFNLMTLQQSGKVLSSTLDLDELISLSIDMFIETVWANKGVLMLYNDDELELEVKASKGLSDEELNELTRNSAEAWAMTTIQKEKKAILSHELSGKAFNQSYTVINKDLPFALYIPMVKEGELYGVIKVGAKINGQEFNEHDLEFLLTLSSQAVIAFENARLYYLAITDSMTKLYVHRYFQLRLEEEISRSKRYNSTISLLMCDIDSFKPINDNYGHQQGDIILKEISKIIRKNIRNTDVAARYGGEEFTVILPETTQSDARIVAERIRRDVHKHNFQPLITGQPSLKCTISIGIAGYPINATNKDELIQKADTALYCAKKAGRNKVELCGVSVCANEN